MCISRASPLLKKKLTSARHVHLVIITPFCIPVIFILHSHGETNPQQCEARNHTHIITCHHHCQVGKLHTSEIATF